ncbi:MAG: glycosyltransferase family 2 protein [Myxococcota bacterium]|nr:glycosyltransferase family 2 protein [Myxococcota bacterium]
MIELSIVVVSWNRCDLTLSCLAAAEAAADLLSEQTVQIILVDNGSEDKTAEQVRSLHPSVALIALDRNYGFARGANIGADRAGGRVILFLNTDAIIQAAVCEAALAHLAASPKTAIVGPQLLHQSGRLQNSAHAFPSLLDELVPAWLIDWMWPGRRPAKRAVGSMPRRVQAVQGAAIFVRRAVFESLGGFCQDYFFYLEETDLCWRVRECGQVVELLPGHSVVHQSGSSSKAVVPVASRIEYHRSLYRFLRTRSGRGAEWVALSVRVLRGALVVLGLSLFSFAGEGVRRRLRERSALLSWHLRGRPASAGLKGASVDGPSG